MPSPDTPIVTTTETLPTLAKSLRMMYEDRLNLSRKLFNLSRKRVENLKKNQNVKRFRNIEKNEDESWITSGRIGSRDAVLVFRTDILNSSAKSFALESSTSSTLDTSKSIPYNNTSIDFESINQCETVKNSDSVYYAAATLPSTSRKINTVVINITERDNVSHRKSLICREDLHKSLSSSENSISSECDNLQEDEQDGSILPDTNKTKCGHITSNEGSKNNYSVDCGSNVANYIDQESNFFDDFEDRPYTSHMPAIKLKIKYKFIQTETKLLKKIFVRHGLSEVDCDGNFNILWTGIHLKPDILRNLSPYQRVNHFPRSYELTRKDRLYKNIEKMQHLRGLKHFDIVPQSFILPLEYKDLVTAHNKHRGPWIVKPAASSRGRGIFIVNTPDQIPQEEQVLVSKYVADPLCIDGHKCDLRVYVLVTSFDPLVIYLYEEGLVRLATVKYDRKADNLWNPCMHLCNYSINKYHSDYIKSSDALVEDVGHKWTLSALLRHLKSQGCDTKQLMLNVEDLIIKSILSCSQSVISACRMFVQSGNNCFELYGFDILIDDTLKPWLLEVNLSPSMGVDSPLDTKVKACLITDLLTCIGIPAYSPTMREHCDSKWSRFRNVNTTRRTASADLTPNWTNNGISKRLRNTTLTNSSLSLTLDEQRIIRNVRLQNARRGGFVRIFPTEDTMQRYGSFLDPTTGIAMSTPIAPGQISYSMILPHNYNQMLFINLYGKDSRDGGSKEENSLIQRMKQYERALETSPIVFQKKRIEEKSAEEGKRLRKQIMKLVDNGSELTQLQARQLFSNYLEAVLRRLTHEPRDFHEKLILKFLNRIGGAVKAPVFFRNPENIHVVSKARSAMVAKLLGDFLEQYNRDTEAYIDSFDHFGMVPSKLFDGFLDQSQESDLESVLALHTNRTGTMPYLYNRCGLSIPATPIIPSGLYGFLKVLPAMVVSGSGARDFNKYDGYYKVNEKDIFCIKHEKVPESSKFKRK